MSCYSATIETNAPPEQVLAVLTDPHAIREWSPVPFEVDGERSLVAGSEAYVSGSLAGLRVSFDVQVHEADREGLRLSADGPVALDVTYGLRPTEDGSEVSASISFGRTKGLTARVVRKAAEAMLAAGALDSATGRIARAAEDFAPIAVAA